MIKTITVPSPAIRLEIKASTVVKITLVVMATKLVGDVASEVARPHIRRLTHSLRMRSIDEAHERAAEKIEAEQS